MQRLKAQVLIVFLVGSSLAAIAADREWWPFSCYPMYAGGDESSDLSSFLLEGVRADGTSVSLMGTAAIEPFNPARLTSAFTRLSDPRSPRDRLVRAVQSLLDRYERRRLRGELTGPPLVSLRLYRALWRLDGPVLPRADSPASRVLLAEARR